MHPTTKKLRNAVKHIPGAWVRVYRDGTAWAGCASEFTRSSVGGERMMAVKSALEAAGYRCELNGKPGTSGEHIIDVMI